MAQDQSKIPADSSQRLHLRTWTLVAVGAAAILAYVLTLNNGFVFDDIPVVRDNPLARGLSSTPRIFASGYAKGTRMGTTGLYRPLTVTSFAANYQAGGPSPWHYHLVNMLIHTANAVLVVLLVFRLTRSSFTAAVAGWLFALHPVNSEAVAPVVGRTDLLATFFVLGALIFYAKSLKNGKHRPLFLAASLTCLAGGLLSKEHAVVALGLVMLWDIVTREGGFKEFFRSLGRRLLYPYSLFIGVVIVYLGVRLAVVGGIGVGGTVSVLDNPLVALSQPARFFTAGKVMLAYIFRLVAPVTLAHDYSYPQITPATASESIAALFVIAVVVWALIYSYRRNRNVFFGIAFFAIGFVIVSNLVFLIGTIMAERLLYLPGIGFCIVVAILLDAGRRSLSRKWSARRTRIAVLVVLPALFALLLARTLRRVGDWHSQLTLYRQAVTVVPYNAKVRMTYGQILSKKGDYDEALVQFEKSLSLLEPYGESRLRSFAAEIHFDMANIYKKQGKFDPALAGYQAALKLRPDFAMAHRNLAFLFITRPAQAHKAIHHLERTLELDPDQPDAHKYREILRRYYEQEGKSP